MIDHHTVERILDSADITEVVQEFVTLRKRGVNYLGLCPFHNEKTPSFTVSPSKGIFKCFGCGKGGNAVNFIMEHEHLSYPEALRFLARKYNIEVAERKLSEEEKERKSDRESMLVVTSWAARKFGHYLFDTDEGRAVGLSYFTERGFRRDILEKFDIGYSPERSDTLTADAAKEGYNIDYLVKTGLTIERDSRKFDRFYGRVIFPIHSLSGQVLGFGGRILSADAKAAKYLNSPESEIYHKGKILYGIYQARRAIIKEDKCFLVEGYTDVLSVHESGTENVVASSGTALTPEQARLVKRFTPNITILFDGDEAGLKAALRGIDIVLEEGMNVRIVVLPPGEDPDSLAKKSSVEEFRSYIEANEKDFIRFKTELLLKEAKDDPVRRAEAINDIVRSIAIIPEQISRTVFIKECSNLLQINESVLFNEVSKLRSRRQFQTRNRYPEAGDVAKTAAPQPQPKPRELRGPAYYSERELIRLLLKYGSHEFDREIIGEEEDEDGEQPTAVITVADFIVREVTSDELTFTDKLMASFFEEYLFHVDQGLFPGDQHFVRHTDPAITRTAVDMLADSHELSDLWSKKGTHIDTEDTLLCQVVSQSVLKFKSDKIKEMRNELLKKIGEADSRDDIQSVIAMQKEVSTLNNALHEISKHLGGRIVL